MRVIERALAEDSDIFFDYSGRELEEKDGLVFCVHLKIHSMTSYQLCYFVGLSMLSSWSELLAQEILQP